MAGKHSTERNILFAFVLNLFFAVAEFAGGLFTGSIAILSDSVHDLGDALSIGVSWFLERKSRKQPNEVYTYGYARYSVMGSALTTLVLILGAILVIDNAVRRLIHPVVINYNGMILIAVFGVVINLIAALLTREGDSLNQKAVNLHMLEDVLGWIVVLIGAVIMRFTDLAFIDPVLSILVSVIILISALKNMKETLDILLEKTPEGIRVPEISEHLRSLEGVLDVHHVHIWTLDGQHNYATLHAVAEGDPQQIKQRIREELTEHGIRHATIEIEAPGEPCELSECHVDPADPSPARHHHHH